MRMKIGIMQPYLFPYIGYFQLIHAVDTFVVHDDVQYIKGGWINRNRIQVNNMEHLFTFSLKKDSSLKNINTRQFSDLYIMEKIHFLKLLQNTYSKAPYFTDTYNIVASVFETDERKISPFITRSLSLICDYLKITTPIRISSNLNKNNTLKGQDRVINICQSLHADVYINPIGGITLYAKEIFRKQNISLYFLQTKEPQNIIANRTNIPSLSIIDNMMYYSPVKIKKMLHDYVLL